MSLGQGEDEIEGSDEVMPTISSGKKIFFYYACSNADFACIRRLLRIFGKKEKWKKAKNREKLVAAGARY